MSTKSYLRTLIALMFALWALYVYPDTPPSTTDTPLFTEVTDSLGFTQPDSHWPAGRYELREIIGSGVALFDYNNDSAIDVLHIRFPPPGDAEAPAPNRLFQQQPDGTFLDVTETAGIGHPGYGQGVAIGDVDNDGDADVYVTNYGPDALYINNGDGTFSQQQTAPENREWGTAATFGDYNRDGYLDLYVTNYVQVDSETVCRGKHGIMDYCNPQTFAPTRDRLFRNNGDATFTDVTQESGLAAHPARGLGVVCLDLTGDGWADFYVANDGEANHLWVNQCDGTFTEEAILHGLAFNAYGHPEGSMGIAVADVNDDTRPDLFLTHLSGETNTFYTGSAYAVFLDITETIGIAGCDLPFTGFGCGFIDVENDADLDIALVNGRVKRGAPLAGADTGEFWNLYAEPNLLLLNTPTAPHRPTFSDMSHHAPDLTQPIEVSRGMAFADMDRDGDTDIVLTGLDNRLRCYRNDAPPPAHHWLSVRTMTLGRDALGARVTLRTETRTLTRYILAGTSYLSSSDPIAHFGLGTTDTLQAIEVHWPDGTREKFPSPATDQHLTLYQGEGIRF